MASNQYPYVGKAIMRYQSEEAGDLSFEAEQLIKVLGPSPSDPEYHSLGETLDGESQGSFPKEFVEKVDESEQEHQGHPAGLSASSATSAPATSISSPSPPPSAATPISIPQATDDEPKQIPSDIAVSSPPKTAPIGNIVSPTSGHLPPISPIDTSVPKVTPAPSVPTSETDMPENPLIKTPPEEIASSPLASTASAVDKEELTLPSAASAIPSSSANTALEPPPSPSKAPSAPSSPGAVKVGGMSSSDAAQTIGKGSLAARMAMFQNKDKEAAPAPVPRAPRQPWKPKPALETPASSSALPTPSPAAARATSPSAPISSPRRDPVPSSHSDAPSSSPAGAMSADDAKASIKVGGSLKERMAALQGALGSGAQAAPPPVPAGKPKVWKRPVAAEPVAAEPAPEKPKSKWVVEEDKGEEGGRVEKSGEDLVAPAQEVEKGTGGNEQEAEGQKEEVTKDAASAEEEPAEDDEEAAEKARRAAIAARMAKIGARGPMGMMQAPKPVVPPKRQESATSAAAESESSPSIARPVPTPFAAAAQPLAAAEPSSPTSEHDDEHASVPMTPANTEQQSGAQMSTPLPAMPRRAAPPRRKNQTPKASDPVTADPPSQPKTAEEEELERKEETIGKGQGGAEGAAAAGIALEEVEPEEQNVGGQQEKPVSAAPVIPQTLLETKTLSSDPDALEDNSVEPFSEPIQHRPQAHQAGEVDADEERDEVRQPQRQTSIPIPKRDHAHTEDEAQFRAADELTEALKTGQPVIGPPATESDEHGGKDATVAPPPPPRNSLPPPPPNAARQLDSDAEEEDEEDELEEEGAVDEEDEATAEEIEAENEAEAIPSPFPPHRHQPPSALPPLPVVEPEAEREARRDMPGLEDIDGADAAEEDEEEAPPPPPRRTTLPPPPPVSEPKEEEEEAQLGYLQEPEDSMRQDDEATPPPPPARRPSVPSGPRERPPIMVATSSTAVMEEVSSTAGPATLVRKPSTGGSRPPVPRGLPPTPITTSFEEDAPIAAEPTGLVRKGSMRPAVPQGLPATPIEEDQPSVSPLAQRSPFQIPAASPIEPSSQQPSEPASASASVPEVDEDDEEAVEAARRQTIAARMAKLGGANQMRLFGGPPPVLPRKPVAAEDASPADTGSAQEQKEKTEEGRGVLKEPEEELDEEEADRQRRARVMAKMQSGAMGGVRFGMGGFGAPTPPPAAPMPSEEEQPKEVEEQPIESPAIDQPSPASLASRPSVPVSRPLPPQPTDEDTSFPPITTDSIVDEPTYFDAPSQSVPSVDLIEDDAPPPPPARPARAVPPPTINTTSIPTLDSLDLGSPLAVDSFTASPSSTSISPSLSQPNAQQQQETFQPPSPVASPERRASAKRLSSLLGRSSSRNNSVDLGRQGSSGRGSMDISRQSIDQGGRPVMEERSSSAQLQEQTIREDGGDGPSVGELKELARKFGPTVLRNAEHLLSQAKKASIGDGSPPAFVSEILYASHCFSSPPYGHLIHHRSASDILVHRDDVRSGDVVSLSGCHFKGKKGLVGYHEDVDEALGVVLEFEGGKKEKMKVGMVVRGKGGDSNSYRLDDLKSGEIKFYRPRSA